MSSKRITNMMFRVLMLASMMLVSATALADWPYENMAMDECTVTSHRWRMNTSDRTKLSLVQALYRSNPDSGSDFVACREVINLNPEGGFIFIEGPIVISRTGEDDNRPFVLGGENAADRIELDASRFDTGRFGSYTPEQIGSEEGPEPCLISIVAPYVKIQNITITGVPAGMNAICMYKGSAVMDNVMVSSAGGDAFVFGPSSAGSRIKANSEVGTGVSGTGVVFKSTVDSLSTAILEAVDIGDPLTRWDPAPVDTKDDGFADAPSGSTTFKIQLGDINRYFRNDSSKLQVVTKKLIYTSAPGSTSSVEMGDYIWMEGWVVDMGGTPNETCLSTATNPACCYPATGKAARVQIYTAEAKGFFKYIGELPSLSSDVGLGSVSSRRVGHISAYFKKSEWPERVLMIPESDDGGLGKPRILSIGIGRNDDCSTRTGSGTGTGTGTGTGYNDDGIGFRSIRQCWDERGITSFTMSGGPAPDFDSDGDYLFDDHEDLNKNCRCDRDLGETCWDDKDTDNDGLLDGVEGVCAKVTAEGVIEDVVSCRSPDANNKATADFDDDGKPNAADEDSDNDGRYDYQEDRSIYYSTLLETLRPQDRENIKGLLYTVGQGDRDEHPILVAGQVQECELGTSIIGIGVRYDWYRVVYASATDDTIIERPTRIGEALPQNDEEDEDTGYPVRRIFSCRHQSLASSANFNGTYDEYNLETKLLNVDTDGDNYCDGQGTNCGAAISVPKADKCPTVRDTTNLCKNIPCSKEILLYGVNPDYVNYNLENTPDHFIYDTTNTYPKVLVETDEDGNVIMEGGKPKWRSWWAITNDCFGDLDADGIPNCVEAPSGLCESGAADPQTKLSAARADTDGDGLIDGLNLDVGQKSDVCPTVAGPGGVDEFVEGKTTGYSCGDARLVYDIFPIVSCFLDRDSDNLRDCEEDKNMNARPDTVAGIAGVGVTESDPLAKFSDEDTIDDFREVSGWPLIKTNPADADTDHDGFNDDVEDRDHNGEIDVDPSDAVVQGEDLCPNAQMRDTNPAAKDTDGDGLDDNVELDGVLLVGQDFWDAIEALDFFTSTRNNAISDPRSVDSDRDGLLDNQEYNGIITYTDSNPCMVDSDGDGVQDIDDGCPLNSIYSDAANCGDGGYGPDSDRDGLADRQERELGTDWTKPDTDGDGLKDGDEDINRNGIYEATLHETDATNPDTDSDGLSDGMEVRYPGADPTNADTDGDCIPDGIEDSNHNGDYNAGSETNLASSDTDGDGLYDGQIGGLGEDLDCDGMRDEDEEGRWIETDPKLPDSDFDGTPDYEEMTSGGYFNLSNVERATSGREGCMNVAGSGAAPTSMMYLFGLLLIVNRAVSRCLRKGK